MENRFGSVENLFVLDSTEHRYHREIVGRSNRLIRPNIKYIYYLISATGGDALLVIFESVIGYVVKAVQKISRERIKTMVVKKENQMSGSRKIHGCVLPSTMHIEGCTS